MDKKELSEVWWLGSVIRQPLGAAVALAPIEELDRGTLAVAGIRFDNTHNNCMKFECHMDEIRR